MSRPISSISVEQEAAIRVAVALLRQAKSNLTKGGAHRAAKAVARALKSAEGAQRHAAHRARRTR